MRKWLITVVALAVGVSVSGALLILTNPVRDQVDAYAAARDLPAGSVITQETVLLKAVTITGGVSMLFTRGHESELDGLHASHDLVAGQLIQRNDVMAPGTVADKHVVFVPVRDAPPRIQAIPDPSARSTRTGRVKPCRVCCNLLCATRKHGGPKPCLLRSCRPWTGWPRIGSTAAMLERVRTKGGAGRVYDSPSSFLPLPVSTF